MRRWVVRGGGAFPCDGGRVVVREQHLHISAGSWRGGAPVLQQSEVELVENGFFVDQCLVIEVLDSGHAFSAGDVTDAAEVKGDFLAGRGRSEEADGAFLDHPESSAAG